MATLLVRKRDDGNWEVIKDKGTRASSVEEYKKEAVAVAEEYLKNRDEVEKILVFKSNGYISKVKTLDEDNEIYTTTSVDRTTTAEKKVNDYTISYPIWKERFREDDILSSKDIGKRVHVAGEPNSEKAYLYKIHQPGEDSWPEGGYEVRRRGRAYPTSHFYEEVILHRSEK